MMRCFLNEQEALWRADFSKTFWNLLSGSVQSFHSSEGRVEVTDEASCPSFPQPLAKHGRNVFLLKMEMR